MALIRVDERGSQLVSQAASSLHRVQIVAHRLSEGAENLRGCDVAVPRAELSDADDGSLYWVDLVGLEVFDESGAGLGKVEGLFETGETSVLVVKGAKERMIPFVPAYVKSVDREAKRITVEWKADYDT